MKKYKNLIILGVLAVIAAGYLIAANVDFNDVLTVVGYYDKKISIINTADIHGHIVFDDDTGGYYSLDEVETIMGMPLIKHFVNDVRNKNDNTLFLDCGDMFHGTNEANIKQGKGVVEVANLMGYNAMTLGNHDFNYGISRLMEIKRQLNFPILSANIYKDGKPAFDEYKIFEVGGKKIGVFGLTIADALSFTNSRDTHGVTIEDPIKSAQNMVGILKNKADVIVLISHLGDEADKTLIKKVGGIDLVLSGHTHALYKKADKVNNTYQAEPGGYSTYVGIANMYFREGKLAKVKWCVKSTKDKKKADETVDAAAKEYHTVALEGAKEVVGKSTVKLDGIRSHLRSRETNLANLLTDAMREIGNADITLMNGGGIRGSIPEGDISLYKIGNALPFVNSIVTVEMKGDKIYSAIERGLRPYPNGANGTFLQVSGIKYQFDASKPAGKRLVSVTMDGKPLDKNQYYKVATNDYLYNGGDNYEEFFDSKLINKGQLLKDVLADYLKNKKEVSPKVEGRIKVVNERYK
ncbi:MAG TPA: 5'-nucleotidase C-terminal domain-containing protein [Ruminiclostridium sp.]|nr:5'-nucleotidase C-terminal domain-containing protein [Ruminiclostridium sp.]